MFGVYLGNGVRKGLSFYLRKILESGYIGRIKELHRARRMEFGFVSNLFQDGTYICTK